MSIYGRRKGILDFDRVESTPVWNASAPVAGAARRVTEGDGDMDTSFAAMRKSAPANHLLPSTLKWLRELPVNVAPSALATEFPRILNLMALHWQDRRLCPAYFDELLQDRRGGRRGFVPAVRTEIQALRDFWYVQA